MQTLYRHFDKEGKLLYVGISNNALSRTSQHSRSAKWFDQIANITLELVETREEVVEKEKQAILNEKPLYNIAHIKPKAIKEIVPKVKYILTDTEYSLLSDFIAILKDIEGITDFVQVLYIVDKTDFEELELVLDSLMDICLYHESSPRHWLEATHTDSDTGIVKLRWDIGFMQKLRTLDLEVILEHSDKHQNKRNIRTW